MKTTRWLILLVIVAFAAQAHADAINTYNASWAGNAWDLQRLLDLYAPIADSNLMGTHNSFNSEVYTNTSGIRYIDPQQKYAIFDQLRMGARFIELDVHYTVKMESPVSFPKRLLLCHGTDDHVGCSPNDKYFTEGLSEIRDWLNSGYSENQVLILYIEGHLDGRWDEAVSQINSYIGDAVFLPQSGGCEAIPNTLTKADILSAGKKVIIWDNQSRSCDGSSAAYDALVYTGLGDIGRIWEDATTTSSVVDFFTGGSKDSISGSDVAEAFANGTNIVNLDDMVTDDGRLAAGVWSWAVDEPNDAGGNEDCALQWSSGRWNDADCSLSLPFACSNGTDWRITGTTGAWNQGEAVCRNEFGTAYTFDVPTSSLDNQKLLTAATAHGTDQVWLNYSDRIVEGAWQIGDRDPVIVPECREACHDETVGCDTITVCETICE